jgi:hypothetical protein
MVMLDANRRHQPVPALAKWSLGVGIVAPVGANLAHGLGHGVVGALVSAWPASALVGSYELLMALVRTDQHTTVAGASAVTGRDGAPPTRPNESAGPMDVPTLEQVVQARHADGASQRAISRDLNIDRRKVKRMIG